MARNIDGEIDRIHICVHYKQLGLTRRKIADAIVEDFDTPFTEYDVKRYLDRARAAWVKKALPVEDLQDAWPIVHERAQVIEAEMDRRDNLLENKLTNRAISREYRDTLTLDSLSKIFQPGRGHRAEEDADKFRKQLIGYSPGSSAHYEVAIQDISDLHHCRFQNGVMNESVTEGALERYRNKCANLLARQRSHCHVEKLVMAINGDIIHGYWNFPNQPREVTGTLSHQIASGADLLIKHIELEYNQYGEIEVYCLGGNHGRKGPHQDLIMDNAEVDMYRIVEAYFRKYQYIKFHIIDDNFYTIADVMGRKYLITHGDAIKGAGNPQAIANTVVKWQTIFPHFDEVIMGHFHRLIRLPLPTPVNEYIGRSLWINGTGSIDDTFLQGFGSSPSLAWWYLFCDGTRSTGSWDVSLYG